MLLTLDDALLTNITNLQCTIVGALLSPYFFLASLVAVTNPTNRATLGMARSFHEVNRICETSREEEDFCVLGMVCFYKCGVTLNTLILHIKMIISIITDILY